MGTGERLQLIRTLSILPSTVINPLGLIALSQLEFRACVVKLSVFVRSGHRKSGGSSAFPLGTGQIVCSVDF